MRSPLQHEWMVSVFLLFSIYFPCQEFQNHSEDEQMTRPDIASDLGLRNVLSNTHLILLDGFSQRGPDQFNFRLRLFSDGKGLEPDKVAKWTSITETVQLT